MIILTSSFFHIIEWLTLTNSWYTSSYLPNSVPWWCAQLTVPPLVSLLCIPWTHDRQFEHSSRSAWSLWILPKRCSRWIVPLVFTQVGRLWAFPSWGKSQVGLPSLEDLFPSRVSWHSCGITPNATSIAVSLIRTELSSPHCSSLKVLIATLWPLSSS